MSLREACSDLGIAPSTTLKLVSEDQTFGERYVRARQVGYTLLGDDLREVADDPTIEPEHKRIMVDTRKWVLSKMLPRLYGDTPSVSVNVAVSANPRYVAAAEVIEQSQDAPKLPE